MITTTIKANKELIDKIPARFKKQEFVDACIRFGLENQEEIFDKTTKPKYIITNKKSPEKIRQGK